MYCPGFDVLRTVIFSRGGIPTDLIFRIQVITCVAVLTEAQLKKPFDTCKKVVLDCFKNNPVPMS